MYKILFGIPANWPDAGGTVVNEQGFIIDYEQQEDNGSIWCDFELNQDEDGYHLSFETMLGWKERDGARKWIEYCLEELTRYMDSHGIATDRELNLYQVFTDGINANTCFNSIQDAYAFMKLMVHGFRGEGLTV